MIFFVLPIFDGVTIDGHPIFYFWWMLVTTQNIGCPSIMTPSEMDETKNLIFYYQNHRYHYCCNQRLRKRLLQTRAKLCV